VVQTPIVSPFQHADVCSTSSRDEAEECRPACNGDSFKFMPGTARACSRLLNAANRPNQLSSSAKAARHD
jgi:hypothetical protein